MIFQFFHLLLLFCDYLCRVCNRIFLFIYLFDYLYLLLFFSLFFSCIVLRGIFHTLANHSRRRESLQWDISGLAACLDQTVSHGDVLWNHDWVSLVDIFPKMSLVINNPVFQICFYLYLNFEFYSCHFMSVFVGCEGSGKSFCVFYNFIFNPYSTLCCCCTKRALHVNLELNEISIFSCLHQIDWYGQNKYYCFKTIYFFLTLLLCS